MNERRIEEVEKYFGQKELGLKPIPAAEQFRRRLQELTEGKQISVVMFNCLDFTWKQAEFGEYPKSEVLDDTSTGNVVYYQKEVINMAQQLKTLGDPAISIIIPDSELFDNRPFNHSQDLQTRQAIMERVWAGLNERLTDLRRETRASILTWSEYCTQFVPLSWTPEEFTKSQYERIDNNPTLAKKVREQARDSRRHFVRRGLDSEYVTSIPEEIMLDKTKWYCAMYMGEATALSISRAVVLNLEDARVKTWYIRGASNLPILTPIDPNVYYKWRNTTKDVLHIETKK